MSKKLTKDDVLNLARLSKLDLTASEVERYIKELNEILDYVELLSDVDTSGLKPTTQVTGLINVMRKDEVRTQLATPSQLLGIAPDTKDCYIKVKRMI